MSATSFEYNRGGGKSLLADAPNAIGGGGGSATSLDHTSVNTCCMIDDVNGDGSLLVPFIRASLLTVSGGVLTSAPLGDYTDGKLDAPYVSIGTVSLEGDVGSMAEVKQDSFTVQGGESWSPTALTQSYTIRVVNPTGVTFTGSNAIPRALVAGEVITMDTSQAFADAAPVLSTSSSGAVVITHTYLGSV